MDIVYSGNGIKELHHNIVEYSLFTFWNNSLIQNLERNHFAACTVARTCNRTRVTINQTAYTCSSNTVA